MPKSSVATVSLRRSTRSSSDSVGKRQASSNGTAANEGLLPFSACLTAGGWPGSERHGRRSEARRDTMSRRADPEPAVGREASRSDGSPASKARRAKSWGVLLFGCFLGQARKYPRAPRTASDPCRTAQPACETCRLVPRLAVSRLALDVVLKFDAQRKAASKRQNPRQGHPCRGFLVLSWLCRSIRSRTAPRPSRYAACPPEHRPGGCRRRRSRR